MIHAAVYITAQRYTLFKSQSLELWSVHKHTNSSYDVAFPLVYHITNVCLFSYQSHTTGNL